MDYEKGHVYELMDQGGPTDVSYFEEFLLHLFVILEIG